METVMKTGWQRLAACLMSVLLALSCGFAGVLTSAGKATADTGTGDPTAEGKQTIEIRGLEEGSVVAFYKVASYTDGEGFDWLIDATDLPIIKGITENIDSWTTDQANTIVSRAVAATGLSTKTATADSKGVAKAEVDERGLWAATVKNPANASMVYQNMILAVNTLTDASYVDVKSSNVNIIIQGEGTSSKTPSVGVGEQVTFQTTTIEPVYNSDAKDRVYKITVTLPDGLTYGEVSNVTDGTTTFVEGTDYAVAILDGVVTITFTDTGISKFTAGNEITADITATREAGHDGKLTATASLEFSDDSYTDNTTTMDVVLPFAVYDFNITLTKVDSKDATTTLKGAKFTLKNKTTGKYLAADGTQSDTAVELSVSDTGVLAVKGLGEAEYELTETTAPDGYAKPTNPFTFKVEPAYGESTTELNDPLTGWKITGDFTAIGNVADTGNEAAFNVPNTKLGILPQTGEIGTIALTVAGIALVAGAIVLAVRRKQSSKTEA